MLVTVTKPLEEAVNIVPGLDHVCSITSRGTAEIDLFFNWNVDMYQTLELVNAALARVQPTLPATAKLTANRLTFAAFPDHRLQPDVGHDSADHALGTGQLRHQAAPQSRRPAFPRWWCRAARCRNSKCSPIPAKLVQAGVTIPEHPGRHRPQQHDRFAGPDRDQSPAGAQPGERPDANAGRNRQHRRQDHAGGRARAHRRRRARCIRR